MNTGKNPEPLSPFCFFYDLLTTLLDLSSHLCYLIIGKTYNLNNGELG